MRGGALVVLALFVLPRSAFGQDHWSTKHYVTITGVGAPLDLGSRLLIPPLRSTAAIRVIDVGAFEFLQQIVQGERARLLNECPTSGACRWDWREVYLPMVGAAVTEGLIALFKKALR